MSSGRELSKHEKEKQKFIQEKCQALLNEMLRDEDNKYCVDCDAKGPRWASWNLGIFLCIRCAGIHRNLGVHISRVKSVNLDTWTPEQVVTMQQMGNSRARAVYEANLPDSFRRPQIDTALENFIRAKYETHKYIAQEWVKPPPPKVNWDSEVEESLKKKKDKKTVTNDMAPFPTAIPKPKPTNSSPATVTKLNNPLKQETNADKSPELNEASSQPNRPTTASEDLFGLMTGPTVSASSTSPSDPFASPVKAPTTSDGNLQDDLGSVFASDMSGLDAITPGQKMTKESILSLYGQPPTANINPFASQGMYANVANPPPGGNNPFPQMPTGYSSNAMGQPHQGPNPYGNIQNDLTILNGAGGTNNIFNNHQDISHVQQQMYGLNLSNFGQGPGGMPSTVPNFGMGLNNGGGGGVGFPQGASQNKLFMPQSMSTKSMGGGQQNLMTGSHVNNPLGGLNNSSGTNNNASQLIFPKDGPISASNLWK